MRIEIKNGCVCEVDEDALDNMELVEALEDVRDDNPIAVSRVAELLLGKERKRQLYDALRTEKGRVPASAVSSAIVKIFDAFGKTGKNS